MVSAKLLVRFQFFSDESLHFQEKLLEKSGVGSGTCFPAGITDALEKSQAPTFQAAMAETTSIIVFIVEDLLARQVSCLLR